jgi:hypothetical protein
MGWLLAVIFLPVLGSILYWTLRKPTEKDIQRAKAAAAERPRSRQPGAGL